MTQTKSELLDELVQLCARLREKEGCMWDRQQTHKSLIPCLEEESKEVIEAIENNDINNLKEELGDLLYQVVFHAQIASENNKFDLYDVLKDIRDKIIRRHPHVFGNTQVNSVKDILKNWKEIKKSEKKKKL